MRAPAWASSTAAHGMRQQFPSSSLLVPRLDVSHEQHMARRTAWALKLAEWHGRSRGGAGREGGVL